MIKELFLNRKLATKLLIYTLVFSALITFFFAAIQLYIEYKEGYSKIQKEFTQIQSSYSKSLAHSSWVYDTQQINLLLDGIVNKESIEYVELKFTDKTLLNKGALHSTRILQKSMPIFYMQGSEKVALGELTVVADLDSLYARFYKKILFLLLSQGIETFVGVFLILFIFKKLLINHIATIAHYMKSLNFTTKAKPLVLKKYISPTHKDELDELVLSINTMQDKLYESYDALSKELLKRELAEQSLLESKKRLEKLYMTDPLTGQGNRNKLIHDLECSPKNAMIIIDIDGFKEINDFYGHEIGDNVIIACAQRLLEYTQDNISTIYRLHSDQFAVVYENIMNTEMFQHNVEELITNVVKESIVIEEYDIFIGVAVGIAVNEENLYIDADLALKIAKKTNKNFVLYNKRYAIEKEYEKNLQWTRKLKNALDDGRITAFFQPIYNQTTKKVEKCEALVRMISEDGEVISPFFFLGVAVKSKLYPQITKIMIDKVAQAAKLYPYEFSINFTIDDMLNPDIRSYFERVVLENGLEGRIVVELVESENIESFEDVAKFIVTLKEKLGCKIAIDDFGTGYSNFEYLLKLQADYVKIDGSLIKNIDKNKNMYLVAENIVNFAKISGMKTIAEFVCSKEIKEILEKINVDYLQGYYISEPVALEEMSKFENL